MSGLRDRAGKYLAMRRALGFKLTSHGSRLMSFVRFCEDRGGAPVSSARATPPRGAGRRGGRVIPELGGA